MADIQERPEVSALRDKNQNYRHIRIMVLGAAGSGKSTLCSNIMTRGHEISPEEKLRICPSEITNGVNIFNQSFEVDLQNGHWKRIPLDSEILNINKRIDKVNKNSEKAIKAHQQNENSTITDDKKGDLPNNRRKFNHYHDANNKLRSNEIALASVWDFAGEDSFNASHHLFLSRSAVYLLVFDLNKCLQFEDEVKKLEDWIHTIKTYRDKEERPETPPIILVGTHVDLLVNESKEESVRTFYQSLFQRPSLLSIKIFATHAVDNKDSAVESFNQIKHSILRSARHQMLWENLLPAKWMILEKELMKMKKQGIKYMSVKDVCELDKMCGSNIGHQEGIHIFLRRLNCTGSIFYKKVDAIREETFLLRKVFLDPQWIVNAFSSIITSTTFIENNSPALLDEWKECANTGVLPIYLMHKIWQQKTDVDFRNDKDILQNCMEKLGLTVRPALSLSPLTRDVHHFIVPSMLPKDVTQLEWLDNILEGEHVVRTSTLCFTFLDNIPDVTFDKFLAVCIYTFPGFYEKDKATQHSPYQRGFGCFRFDETWNMLLMCRMSKVTLTLFSQNERCVDQTVCVEAHDKVRGILMDILDMNLQGHLKYEYKVLKNYKIETGVNVETGSYLDEFHIWFKYDKQNLMKGIEQDHLSYVHHCLTHQRVDVCNFPILHYTAAKGTSRMVKLILQQGGHGLQTLQPEQQTQILELLKIEIDECTLLTPLHLALLAKRKENVRTIVRTFTNPQDIKRCLEFRNPEIDENLVIDQICFALPRPEKSCIVQGYRQNEENSKVLLVYSEEYVYQETDNSFGFEIIRKNPRDVDREGVILSNSRKAREIVLNDEQLYLAKTAIKVHGHKLMTEHSNLNIISGSSVKYNSNKQTIKQFCIVFYCTTKGIIPKGEKPFPKSLSISQNKSIPVDVREGYFELGPLSDPAGMDVDPQPQCLQNIDKLKIGSRIMLENNYSSGTVGPFVDYNGRLGFLTCAHLVNGIDTHGYIIENNAAAPLYIQQLQTIPPETPTRIGEVEKAVFCPHNQTGSGVDAALIRVHYNGSAPSVCFETVTEERLKKAGLKKIPEYGRGLIHKIVDDSPANYSRVIKFGSETSLSHGYLTFEGSCVRPLTISLKTEEDSELTVTMSNQFEVKHLVADSVFFQQGDSGAGVFILENDGNSLKCIGLAIGQTSYYTAVVTPIETVLRALDLEPDRVSLYNPENIRCDNSEQMNMEVA